METENKMEKIVSLCKRRGFVFPGSEIYGGFANSWDYGPIGVELKNNIKQLWWNRFVQRRDDMVGIDAALIMNPKVWEASGHLKEFSDPLVECTECHERFRSDDPVLLFTHVQEKHRKSIQGDRTGTEISGVGFGFTPPKQFNLMFKTFIGPAEEQANVAYFRPETAQAMFVDFKNVLDTSRKTLPFGIAQIGKAFRNEITPGNFIFRTREFEQMEIEYFIPVPARSEDWKDYFEMWRKEMVSWMESDLGLSMDHIHELEVPDGERAHYSKRTIDFEYDFPFGRKELYGLAYRGDFDLKNHFKETAPYKDSETGEAFWPHVIEPTWGVDRSVLAVLCDSYVEDGERIFLKLPPKLAPYKAAIFPLLKNKPELVEKARGIYEDLKKDFMVAWDDRGNIGKRYYAQDEIGTPFCITVDFDTLEKGDVTMRDRDTAKQERIKIEDIRDYLLSKLK
jgi:glycyl-tRNA synthetase